MTNGTGIAFSTANRPAGLPSGQITTWNQLYAEILGFVSQTQALYTRSASVAQPESRRGTDLHSLDSAEV